MVFAKIDHIFSHYIKCHGYSVIYTREFKFSPKQINHIVIQNKFDVWHFYVKILPIHTKNHESYGFVCLIYDGFFLLLRMTNSGNQKMRPLHDAR